LAITLKIYIYIELCFLAKTLKIFNELCFLTNTTKIYIEYFRCHIYLILQTPDS